MLAAALASLAGPAAAATAPPATLAAVPPARLATAPPGALVAGDAAWARRAEGAKGDRAESGPVSEAIAAYEAVIAAEPERLEAIWKLLRALHFKAEFTRMPPAQRARIWERGSELADRAVALLHGGDRSWHDRVPEEAAAAIEDRSLGAAVHFWAAVHWGLWGETKGALPAVRKGIAKVIRDHARLAIALDESYERGGPRRLLGRLHVVAPRVPLVTGWVDHDEGLRHLERAVELAPADPWNRLYLAEATLDLRPSARNRAIAELEAVVAAEPDPEHVVEDSRAQSLARAALAHARRDRSGAKR